MYLRYETISKIFKISLPKISTFWKIYSINHLFYLRFSSFLRRSFRCTKPAKIKNRSELGPNIYWISKKRIEFSIVNLFKISKFFVTFQVSNIDEFSSNLFIIFRRRKFKTLTNPFIYFICWKCRIRWKQWFNIKKIYFDYLNTIVLPSVDISSNQSISISFFNIC
jgi:hypothetical protein